MTHKGHIIFDYEKYSGNEKPFTPHAKQLRFYEAGKYHRFRLALWGNRTGKTFGAGRELFYYASGMYPSWWNGSVYNRPVQIYCLTENIDLCKRNLVTTLFEGDNESVPAIPPEFVIREESSSCKINTRYIKHVMGESVFSFMSYRSGAKAMQGFKADIVLFDERPPLAIFDEMTKRLVSFDGQLSKAIITTWPEGGYTDIVDYFYKGTEEDYIVGVDPVRDLDKNPRIEKPNKFIYFSHASWDDNPYLPDSEKEMMEFSTPPHLLEARRSGVPFLGMGKVFYLPESDYICPQIILKDHYRYILGVDPAVTEHGSWGACLLSVDENNMCRVVRNYQAQGLTKQQHVMNIRDMLPFPRCPLVCDPHGGGEDQETRQGHLDFMTNTHKMNVIPADKTKGSVELGIGLMIEKMLNGTLKICYDPADNTGCSLLIDQMRKYSRGDNGLIIKKDDHVIDAFRYTTRVWNQAKDESFYRHSSGHGRYSSGSRYRKRSNNLALYGG